MRISQLYQNADPVFSFEFFPPKTPKGRSDLLTTIAELRSLDPGFVSVTYGAGGSTRELTLDLVSHIKNELGIETMAHLTCVGSSREELRQVLDALERSGIENIIALRGDPPAGQDDFVPHPDGLAHANDLIELIAGEARPFCLAAAGYPENHTESENAESDLAHLQGKVKAGADVIITQLFFDNAFYFDFVGRARNAGIQTPIVPGIMPVTNVSQIERFTNMCGATIPASLHDRLEPVREDAEAVARIGVEHATEQCRELLEAGAPGVHFYTLNRSASTREILTNLKATRPA